MVLEVLINTAKSVPALTCHLPTGGSGDDHYGEIDFNYRCSIPKDSHHMDLSDIAMGRLQGNGSPTGGVIPIRYSTSRMSQARQYL
jgi:hypothetical protein